MGAFFPFLFPFHFVTSMQRCLFSCNKNKNKNKSSLELL